MVRWIRGASLYGRLGDFWQGMCNKNQRPCGEFVSDLGRWDLLGIYLGNEDLGMGFGGEIWSHLKEAGGFVWEVVLR